MSGLTTMGTVHTAISLVALAAAIGAFVRHGAISMRTSAGRTYVITTVLTCVTGFFIFERGGFGKPHALGIVTLVVLAVAWLAGAKASFGRASRYIETVGYSLTVFFHMIPAFTETSTRVPAHAPLATGPDDPNLQLAVALAFAAFLVGATVQVM